MNANVLQREEFFATPSTSRRTSTAASPSLTWNSRPSSASSGRKSGDGASPSKRSKGPFYYITLAPATSDLDEEDDTASCASSVYDSIHNRETDFCRDSDDYSSDSSTSTTVSDATVPAEREVIEFDVVTASSDDGDYLYIEDSSSGSDNYIVDQQIFVLRDPKDTTRTRMGSCEGVAATSSSGSSTSSGNASANTSDGDSTDEGDPELRPADYWKCVKCNNSQNNPLYRYCEKCYQLRKNYFPPRPKRSKSRVRKKPQGQHHHHHHHHHNHEQSSSDCISSGDEDEDQAGCERTAPKRFKMMSSSSSPSNRLTPLIGNGSNVVAGLSLSQSSSVVMTQTTTTSEGSQETEELNSATKMVEKSKMGLKSAANTFGGIKCSQSVQLRSGEEDHSMISNFNSIDKSLSSRKRSLNMESSQLATTEEDDDGEQPVPVKKVKMTSSTEEEEEKSVDQLKRSSSSIGEGELAYSAADGVTLEGDSSNRPKNLMLLNVIRGVDSGFSSYSSGQESIPSPVEGTPALESQISQVTEGLEVDVEETDSTAADVSSQQASISLSRDFHFNEKSSYSDSETYRRSSTKCVVNKGEANAITRRMQGELMYSKSSGLVPVDGGGEKSDLDGIMGSNNNNGGGLELRATKSLMEKYQEQKEEDRLSNLCIICVSEPKDSAFVHARSLHICCCYKCAIKVWNKKKRCPICNCKVKNVLKCYVH